VIYIVNNLGFHDHLYRALQPSLDAGRVPFLNSAAVVEPTTRAPTCRTRTSPTKPIVGSPSNSNGSSVIGRPRSSRRSERAGLVRTRRERDQ
jgi:hypothetical protein